MSFILSRLTCLGLSCGLISLVAGVRAEAVPISHTYDIVATLSGGGVVSGTVAATFDVAVSSTGPAIVAVPGLTFEAVTYDYIAASGGQLNVGGGDAFSVTAGTNDVLVIITNVQDAPQLVGFLYSQVGLDEFLFATSGTATEVVRTVPEPGLLMLMLLTTLAALRPRGVGGSRHASEAIARDVSSNG